MSRFYVPLLLLLAAIWGASFMFIKVANRDFEPWTMMFFRLLIAALIMWGVLIGQRGTAGAVADVRRLGWAGLLLGVANGAIPFTLIAWGETHVDSGVAAIANASMPIFVALFALRYVRQERSSGVRLLGVVVGLLGVAVLAGVNPRGGWWAAAGTLAVILASISYAGSSLWAQDLVSRTTPLALVTSTMTGGALVLLPLGLAELPAGLPGWKELGSVLALAVLGTAIGQLIYYRLVATDGSARASLVTYLLPVTALFYGVTLLDEPLTVAELVGLVLILGGVALGSGVVRLTRRETAPAAPTP
ncbi:MAG TPA: DMT family transporter [Gaiellaceae bacterium]|nr:DMT family transporter [Gaiellaceae bacterium]